MLRCIDWQQDLNWITQRPGAQQCRAPGSAFYESSASVVAAAVPLLTAMSTMSFLDLAPSGSSPAEQHYLQVLQQQHTCAGTQAPSAYPAFFRNDWDCGRNGWTVALAEDHTLLSCAAHGPYALGATTNYRITWSNSSSLKYCINLVDLK